MSGGPSSIELGGVTLYTYSLIIVLAFVVAVGVGVFRARRRDLPAEAVVSMGMWGLILSVIVGRLFFVLNPPPGVVIYYDRAWYLRNIFDLQIGPLAVWSGGLGAAGMVVGALLGVGVVVWRRWKSDSHPPFNKYAREWAETLTPGVIAGLVIGPWAGVVSGQVFGAPTRLPWAMAVARRPYPFNDMEIFPAETGFHPVGAYLSLWALASLVVLLVTEQRRADTRVVQLGIMLLAPGVFLLGFLMRNVSRPLLGLTGLQVLAGLGMLTIIVRWSYFRQKS